MQYLVLGMHRSGTSAVVRLLNLARSLQTREGLPKPYAIALWEKYHLAALEHSRNLPRVLISHRDLMEQPLQTAASLHQELVALGAEGLHMPARETIESFIDPNLFCEHYDVGSLESQHLNQAQARVLEALRDRSVLDWEEIPALYCGAHDILINYPETIDPSPPPDPEDQGQDGAGRDAELERQLGSLHPKLDHQLKNLERLKGVVESRFVRLEHGTTKWLTRPV